jgi:hypothetical protein
MGRNLVQRHEDEAAISQARMGKFKIRFTETQVSHQQDIQVECTGAIRDASGAVPTEFEFDLEQPFEQGVGGEAGLEGDGRVEEAGLIGKAYGRRGVEGGTADNTAKMSQAGYCCAERCGRRADGAGKVGAHPDVSRAHEDQGISAEGL